MGYDAGLYHNIYMYLKTNHKLLSTLTTKIRKTDSKPRFKIHMTVVCLKMYIKVLLKLIITLAPTQILKRDLNWEGSGSTSPLHIRVEYHVTHCNTRGMFTASITKPFLSCFSACFNMTKIGLHVSYCQLINASVFRNLKIY